jgi:hypothetical protein
MFITAICGTAVNLMMMKILHQDVGGGGHGHSHGGHGHSHGGAGENINVKVCRLGRRLPMVSDSITFIAFVMKS